MSNISPQKRSSSSAVALSGQMLGTKLFSFAKSRLPIPNKPKIHAHRRRFLNVAPIPFAPLVDVHAFQPPPPPYSVHADESAKFLRVPHNTPELSAPVGVESSLVLSTATVNYTRPIGLGLAGVENGDGERFNGLGQLSGGFRASLRGVDTNDGLREEVHRMLTEHSRRQRTRTRERPAKQHDVFYASVEVRARDQIASSLPTGTVKIRFRRKSAGSPTPISRRWDGVRRDTISSELKRAASLERRASLSETTTSGWRV